MRTSSLLGTTLVAAVVVATNVTFSTASRADLVGDSLPFSFTCGIGGGLANCGQPAFGSVTATVTSIAGGGDTIQFTATLNPGFQFINGGQIDFGVNIDTTGNGVATVTPPAGGFTTTPPGTTNGDGFGDFNFGIDGPAGANGASNPLGTSLTFSLFATGLTLSDIKPNDKGFLFVADIVNNCQPSDTNCGTSVHPNAVTGAIAVPVPGPIVGAGLPGAVMACGGLLGLARRRRKKIA